MNATRFASTLTLGLAVLGGCAHPTPLVAQAARGELSTLRMQLPPRLAAGTLGRSEARALARATVGYELAQARGEDGVHRVLEAEACVHAAASSLRALSKGRDAAAAEALVVLYEAGEISRSAARAHEDDPDSRFRRVAVRALDEPGDHAARLAYFESSDGALRIMALRAAMIGGDPREAAALRERARIDPEPDARSNAVRALALLDHPPPDQASFLVDLAKTADPATRGDIAVALALSPTFERGGREALLTLVADDNARVDERVTTALLLLRTRHGDAAIRGLVESVLVHALENGPVPVRLEIVRSAATQTDKLREAVRTIAKKEGKTELGIAASESSLSDERVPEPERSAARARLYELAKVDGGLGTRARVALARAGDRRVQAWLEHDLGAADAARRLMAARGLVALDAAGRAAPLLADPSATVRMRAACMILGNPPSQSL